MNKATFVSFSCNVNLDLLPIGTPFQASWTLRNSGRQPWGPNYNVALIHANRGSQLLASKPSFSLAEVGSQTVVRPGENVTITLKMVAPGTPNHRFFTDWQLQDPQGRFFGDILWLRLVTIPVAAPIEEPPVGVNNSRFVDDHSIPDGTPIEEGKPFLKQWVIRNSGDLPWTDGYRLVLVGGDVGMTTAVSFTVPHAQPKEEVVLAVPMVSPTARNDPYISSWRLHDDKNQPFGDTVWAKIFSTRATDGLGIRPFSQNDPLWKQARLGHGSKTFGEFGCLLSCMAMMLTGFGEDFTPLGLNNRLLGRQGEYGFDGSNVYFLAPAALINHVQFYGNWMPLPQTGATFATYDPNLLTRVDQEIAAGQAVIFQVDLNPNNPYVYGAEQHWVFALAKQGDDYLVLDPSDGRPVSLLSRFGSKTSQPGEQALKSAIKSALIYRSTKARIRKTAVALPDVPPVVKDEGVSDIGKSETKELYNGPAWQFQRLLKGVHDRANRHPMPADWAIARGKFETVKVMSGVTVQEMNSYEADFYLCRLFESWNGRHVPVQDFVNTVSTDIAPLVNAGVTHFEFHNEPNLTHEGLRYRGVAGSWSNGAEFAQYFLEGRKLLRQRFPGIKIGFPGLSPGADAAYRFGHDAGFRLNDTSFVQQAEAAIREADFLCVHAYYLTMEEVETEAIGLVKRFRRLFPNKLIFVSEFSNPDPQHNIPASEKGKQAKRFYELCSQIPGVAAAYYFIVSGSGWDHQALRRDGDGRSTGIIEHMF